MSPTVSNSGFSHLVAEVEAVVVVKAFEFSLETGTIEILRETQSLFYFFILYNGSLFTILF